MPRIRTVFCDLGGVVLTNGWDAPSRKKAAAFFHFDLDEFEARHAAVEDAFETGRITVDQYLEQTLFFKPRLFTQQELKTFILSLSEVHGPVLDIVRHLAESRQYQMATLNNESLDFNLYRIEKFHLRDYFSAFFSSCFLGFRKPYRDIYDKALQITQRNPSECLFIDDRTKNLEVPRLLGMQVIHFKNAPQLQEELNYFLKNQTANLLR